MKQKNYARDNEYRITYFEQDNIILSQNCVMIDTFYV